MYMQKYCKGCTAKFRNYTLNGSLLRVTAYNSITEIEVATKKLSQRQGSTKWTTSALYSRFTFALYFSHKSEATFSLTKEKRKGILWRERMCARHRVFYTVNKERHVRGANAVAIRFTSSDPLTLTYVMGSTISKSASEYRWLNQPNEDQ